jgi:hypothetical protein
VNLAGGLAGLGTAMTYIGQQGLKDQQDAAHDQALLDREEALKRLEIDAKREDRHNALADAKELSTYTTNEKVRGATAEARALQPIKQGEQDHASALRLKEADVAFDRDMKKLEKTQGFQLSLAQYQAGQEAYRQAAADGRKIVATGVNADGDVTYALGDGGVRIERGMKPTPRGSSKLPIPSPTPSTARTALQPPPAAAGGRSSHREQPHRLRRPSRTAAFSRSTRSRTRRNIPACSTTGKKSRSMRRGGCIRARSNGRPR